MCGSIHTNHYHQRLHYVTLYNHPYAKQFFALLLHCLHHNSLRNEQYTIKHYITSPTLLQPSQQTVEKIRKKNKIVFLLIFLIYCHLKHAATIHVIQPTKQPSKQSYKYILHVVFFSLKLVYVCIVYVCG